MPEPFAVLLDQNVPPRDYELASAAEAVRLRVWPTTVEETQAAIERLLAEVPDRDLTGALVIIDRTRIRVRSGWPGNR